MEDLNSTLTQYKDQLLLVNQAIDATRDENECKSLLTLQSDLKQLIQLTQESLDTLNTKDILETSTNSEKVQSENKNDLDAEYSLFMQEMANSGAYETQNNQQQSESNDSDIEDELSSLLGMKCAVYHTHKWGGQPCLYNAMVSAVLPHQNDDQFKDLKVQVLFTHPTHPEMLPCPFYLDGECRFNDEQCRYSHGTIIQLSSLKEAIEPDFSNLRTGSRVLLKLKPPDDQDISLTKKSTEKYHLWHRAIVKSVNEENQTCQVKLEHGVKSGEKRKSISDEFTISIEDIFPLNNEDDNGSDTSDISDTEYPDCKTTRLELGKHALLVEKSLQNNAPAMGEWERHTRGIGSKLMLAMGYVPGTGLGVEGDGRLQPVEARVLPVGKSLDHCMAISEKNATRDPLKVEQRLKRLQKKEEERNKKAYEREKEKEKRNVFNFINNTLANKVEKQPSKTSVDGDIKQSSSKDLNVEQFKITENVKRIEREITKLNNSLRNYSAGSDVHRSLNMQVLERNKELSSLQHREQQIHNEQKQRKDKQKMSVF